MTIQKNISDSPRKLRLVADMIRKMTPAQAVETLSFADQAAAGPLAKAIKTAMANAGKETNLFFKSIEINEGMKLKRYRAGTAGRGRGRPYKKRWSHIRIILTDEAVSQESRGKKQEIKKAAVPTVISIRPAGEKSADSVKNDKKEAKEKKGAK